MSILLATIGIALALAIFAALGGIPQTPASLNLVHRDGARGTIPLARGTLRAALDVVNLVLVFDSPLR